MIIAKTNVPQTLAALDSVNNVFGRTINPFNSAVTAGGSSGGEGVMVAMRGSMIGIGTDIGGSIRIPAMCNGIVGLKACPGRFPYWGQQDAGERGLSSIGVQPSAGPLARTIDDAAFLFREVASRSSQWGVDCIPCTDSDLDENIVGCGADNEFVIGILRHDGHATPLPPISDLLDEVVEKLQAPGTSLGQSKTPAPTFKIVELPSAASSAMNEAGSLLLKFLIIDGVVKTAGLLEQNQEPVIPWLRSRFRSRPPFKIADVEKISAAREDVKEWMLNNIWYDSSAPATSPTGQRKRRIDAIICPVAPHPVPPIDRWGGIGFTGSFVLLDYAAASLPVKMVRDSDLKTSTPLPPLPPPAPSPQGTKIDLYEQVTRTLCKFHTYPLFLLLLCNLS